MKKIAIALVLAVVALAANSGLAQNIALRADVPMAFSIEGRHYAAGSYQLRSIANNLIELSDAKTGDASLVKLMYQHQRIGMSTPEPNLKFRVNGKRAYLMSVTDKDGNTWEVRVSPADQEAFRESQAKTVIVALK